MTILNDHCPGCGVKTDASELTAFLLEASLSIVFGQIRRSALDQLRSNVVGTHSSLLQSLVGYCEECALDRAENNQPPELPWAGVSN